MKRITIATAGALALAASAHAGVYNGSGMSIPDNAPAGVSSTISVSGDTPSIGGVNVTLMGFTHTWLGDLNATLTSPSGTSFSLFTRIGAPDQGTFGDSSNVSGDYRLTDSASSTLWTASLVGGDTYTIPGGDYRTSAAGSNTATSLSGAFAGQNSNGTWTLAISDNAGSDVGGIQGWRLDIAVAPAPGPIALAGLGGVLIARRRR